MSSLRFYCNTAFLACCLLFAFTSGTVMAAAKKAPPPPPDMRKLIQKVDAAHGSVTIVYQHSHKTKEYKVDAMTSIKIDGSTGKLSDVKGGMEVSDYTERDNDNLDGLVLLSRTSAPTVAYNSATPEANEAKKIEQVDVANNTVTILFMHSTLMRTYHVDMTTALQVNGVKGTLADVKPGQDVKDFTERDNDDLDALTVNGYGEEPKAPAPKPAAKPKPVAPKPKPAATPAQ